MNKKKSQAFLQLGLIVGILIFINILANYIYGYIDLTEEKRFTLTQPTQRLLGDLDDVVSVQVLLDGEFPAGFKRLQNSVREVLEDFRAESGYVEYEFSDPMSGNVEQNRARQEQLQKDGIVGTNLRLKDSDGQSERIIFPFAVFNYKGRSYPVNLLENQQIGTPQEVVLNNSVSLLEYKFADAIQKLQTNNKPNIIFIEGHGELAQPQVYDLERTLRQYYDTGHLNLDSLLTMPADKISVAIIAKPRGVFSEKDKFKLDQYVMNGGKLLWLIDRLNVSLDSINIQGKYVPTDYQLNLEDLWFKYGIRIDPNLVLDLESSGIPLKVGEVGGQPKFELFPFHYHPLVAPKSKHPVVKSLDRVNLQFPSSIDTTVQTKTPVEKTVLLSSSARSRVQFIPTTLDFNFLRTEPNPAIFNQPFQPMAVLYEGVFPSLYANRVAEGMMQTLQQLNIEFRAESVPNRMIVVADGDIARNEVKANPNSPNGFSAAPLGRNQFEQYTFANKDFLLNAIEYLLDNDGVIEARGKEVKLRMLDTVRAEAEETKWQMINLVLPLVFLVAFGLVYNWIRRRRYAK